MHNAVITIDFDSEKEATVVYGSLLPELSKKIPQTEVDVTRAEKQIILSITAQSTPVLRAAINSYSRWIQTAFNVQKIK
jgi:tRNA threonylcarbamoyladenosine modification (KEOPS) complex  Pcc1 subunit